MAPPFSPPRNETDLRAAKLIRGGIDKLQRTRSTPIVYSDVQEPLTSWKTLCSLKTRWPHTYRRYHLLEGINVADQDCIVHTARDEHIQGKAGLVSGSSGKVKYSHDTMERMLLDVGDVLRILQDKPPNSQMRLWTITQLEKEFRNRWGRTGIWLDNKLPFFTFLSCFHKTFDVFGESNEYVRIRHPWGRLTQPRVLDNPEKVMVNIARLKLPDLMRYQKKMFLNTEDIKGSYEPKAATHLFKTNIKLSRSLIPRDCLPSEERALYGVLGAAQGGGDFIS